MRMNAARSVLLIVDVQERLLPAMAAPDRVVAGCGTLIDGAARLGVPVIASEQYPKGLGPTVEPLKARLRPQAIFAKLSFSCAGDPNLLAGLDATGRPDVIVAGIEAHICVLQTALDLAARGVKVRVVADAVGARRPEAVDLALDRLGRAGIGLVNVEMVLFEWLGRAGTDDFKYLSSLIK